MWRFSNTASRGTGNDTTGTEGVADMDVTINADTIRISGPLRTVHDARVIDQVVSAAHPRRPLVIDVSTVTTLSETGYQALYRAATVHPEEVTIVCSDVMLRCELELTDLGDVAQVQAHALLTISQPQQAA